MVISESELIVLLINSKKVTQWWVRGYYQWGSYPATPLGLFDMGTNGQEWMRDWYSRTYYPAQPAA
ncbi:SUMF1/EgtB/PvdO family nonheme iron enzyme [Enterobacter hormaechei]|jgi:formylglycine-generating enzyme required for sulfatase activity|uniref:SUMF1/EgtB/PvdO family nonheme iron enzyme n=2 Tax=Enterobacteriaceae TaxID=543 RepID=UPI000798C211|nr:SUMF1/EgtB/PvdO family nonheme iron enzyme [Enterobacter cloacae complex sp. P39RS]MBS6132197.1 SUMF1/EgtB/PvdO family nonheme iron enzyme [Enterobacter cloacae]MBT1809740.1 SUMF1/EgtB/PvdO family nonheme iron enzyme [Enterobacter hormaechei subsp. xiangfangensis]CZX73550.1 Uncharacterised protein [Enterobacter hormaechei]HAV1456773.1 formylglycine-generating enzyme family protein [Enterobacter hormaechei subsp. steigerwaltii]